MSDNFWYKDAIIYELHVKAFLDSNGDGRGDFQGLTRKLDYLQDLGITALWLLPFYPSPLRDDGYDIADYRGVHPDYGKMADFKRFLREAHRRGLRVITELVVNHTSDQHPWFQEARRAKPGSARRNYYVWSDTDTRYADTRIIFTDTEISNWAWDPVAGAYYWHRFFSHQPDLNMSNPAVVKAMIRVLRFWMDLGVDGVRLDAVPYLCEREGTNNENLPETHAVIREFRREVDQRYPGRMLLAEANQWPTEVRPYFGDGDECHMAFHFPLMPRIFMALRQEDRRPITEILNNTPEIPAVCQWALFLRNHDELTLEMVTDEERDYMYREYAKDERMRINIGIRRRLAPLVQNSRRRLELLNSLLFSLPGTPVLYYGDEIGMGDNIYVGDRDGVRTPMQWSTDRNAGFSTADPARLYLPLIMDPVYGYQSVNVEAQERDPSSLLQLMKRMIALRKQYKAFGRGTMEFLSPANRKVLAYVRRYRKEVILVVVNLSRFVQPVELDLSAFAGRIPVELIGRTEFPNIGKRPYFLALGPHAFYWFRLEPAAEPVRIPSRKRPQSAVKSGDLPVIELEDSLDSLFAGDRLQRFESEILLKYLPRQRWFRAKARELAGVKVADWCKLGANLYLMNVEVALSGGGRQVYILMLKGVFGAQARRATRAVPESLVAGISSPRGEGLLFDALTDQTSVMGLLAAMSDGRTFSTHEGEVLRAFTTRSYAEEKGQAEILGESQGPSRMRRLTAEQSNTSIIIDDELVLKMLRTVEAGPNPDLEIGLQLTEKTGFRNFPRVVGGITYGRHGEADSTIAVLQWFVPNEGDGWSFMLKEARKVLRRILAGKATLDPPDAGSRFSPSEEPPEEVRAALGKSLEAGRLLGRRTAELHLALAAVDGPDFRPESLSPSRLETLAEECGHAAGATFALLGMRTSALPEEARGPAARVLDSADRLTAALQEILHVRDAGKRIRCHGDYHLGQVLRSKEDFVILDFEGEPMRPLPERRRKQSPLKDVAGMLRSFDYAAQTALREVAGADPEKSEALEAAATAWGAWTSGEFLRAYLEVPGIDEILPEGRPSFETLLRAFLIDKGLYELDYELNNRPDWAVVPLCGLLGLAGPAAGREAA